MSWIQTYTGKRFDLLNPRVEDIDIEDIAHALAMLARFNGHTMRPYSVAQHSVIVSHIVAPEYAMAGLLHDAAEAYIGDVTQPLKCCLDGFGPIERKIQLAVAKRFGLTYNVAAIKHADMVALATERRDLMLPTDDVWSVTEDPMPETIIPWEWEWSKAAFLERFKELSRVPAELPS